MCKELLSEAVNALNNGFLIVYPTDTLYGIGADIFNDKAVEKVFRVKKRSFSNPLSVAVSSVDDLEKLAFVDKKAESLIDFFLPGCLTLILRKKKVVSDLITSRTDKVAVRIPDNKLTLKLLKDSGPITCTSANIHDLKTPSDVYEIREMLKSDDVKVFIDQGNLESKPSTLVDVTFKKVRILREGTIPEKDILDVIKNNG